MGLRTFEFDKQEVALVLRALKELKDRDEIDSSDKDTVVNLVDYIEAEAGL